MGLTGIVPCAEGYATWSYACENCDSAFHMVEARTADGAGSFERRVVARYNVMASGTVEFGGGKFFGMVRNVSAAGARLDLTDSRRIPAHFSLITEGSYLPCSLIWRKEKQIGIAFNRAII
jgi:hypothetical protein